MRIDRIKVRHWRGIKAADIDLRETPRAVVMGANGTGKSSLFILAPLFGLFGHCDTRTQGDQIMRGTDACEVEIFFALRSSTYRVRRTVSTKSGTTLQLDRTGEGDTSVEIIADGRVREVQAAIEELLGFSAAALLCGPLMQQGAAAKFTNATAAERLDYVAEILGAEHWREAYTEARARRREVDKDLERARLLAYARAQKLEALARVGADVVTKRGELEAVALDVAAAEADVDTRAREYQDAAKAWQAVAEKADAIEELRKQLDAARKTEGRAATELAKLSAKHATELEQVKIREEGLGPKPRPLDQIIADGKKARGTHAAYARSRELAAQYRTERDAYRKQARALEGRPADCTMDHCGLIAGALEAQRKLAEVEAKLASRTEATREEVDQAAQHVQAMLDEHAAATLYPEKQKALVAARELARRIGEQHAEAKTKLDDHAAEVSKLEKRIEDQGGESLGATAKLMQAAERVRDKASTELATCRQRHQRLELEIKAAAERLADKRDDLGDEVDLAELEHNLAVADAAVEFCKVAPQIVVEGSVGTIEAVSNDVLADLFPGARLRLEQTKHGSTSSRDELTVQVMHNGVEAPLATFSGGERFRLDLALRLGLSSAAGGEVDSLVLDEGWGSQDPAAVSALKDAIRGLAERFDRIIVITHREEVADLFGAVLTVTAGEDGTTVEVG